MSSSTCFPAPEMHIYSHRETELHQPYSNDHYLTHSSSTPDADVDPYTVSKKKHRVSIPATHDIRVDIGVGWGAGIRQVLVVVIRLVQLRLAMAVDMCFRC